MGSPMNKNEFETRQILSRQHYARVLQVFFERSEGREAQVIPEGFESLYEMDLKLIKDFLLSQHPEDKILNSIFKLYH